MEFPDLGKHCALNECNRLDFLPIKCSSCMKIYCSEHYMYQAHNCNVNSNNNNNLNDHQVPICPLCNKPVSLKFGESLDQKVSEHIDRNCDRQFINEKKIYNNRCSYNGCKQKEIIKILCDKCKLNYCIKHRHSSDHDCNGGIINNNESTSTTTNKWIHPLVKKYNNDQNNVPIRSQTIPQSLNSFTQKSLSTIDQFKTNVVKKFQRSPSSNNNSSITNDRTIINSNINNLQGELTEEEALNIAIAESLSDQHYQQQQSSSNNNHENCQIF